MKAWPFANKTGQFANKALGVKVLQLNAFIARQGLQQDGKVCKPEGLHCQTLNQPWFANKTGSVKVCNQG